MTVWREKGEWVDFIKTWFQMNTIVLKYIVIYLMNIFDVCL